MHEMSITQGVIDICVQNSGGRKVVSVQLEIGELSGVVPEALEFCFAACCEGTSLQGAKLEIVRTSGVGFCIDCNRESPRKSLFDPCLHCGGYRIELRSGDEMRVRELEVEDPPTIC
jgi:hydrogenase nickel incorporation protein HypA/HybF